MAVNNILRLAKWQGEGKLALQVLPQAKAPGAFVARLLVRNEGVLRPEAAVLMRQAVACEAVSAWRVYIASAAAADKSVVLDPAEGAGFLPAGGLELIRSGPAKAEPEYLLIQPGREPDEPVYPVWTRDVVRSFQVVNGQYSEIIPLTFEFVPTLNCLFRCKECAYRPPKEEMGVWQHNDFSPAYHMDELTMKFLLDKLAAGGVSDVLFTGGGEPLLNVATPEGMRYAGQELGMRLGLYTNGVLVTERKARKILAPGPAYVRVSQNAGSKEVYYKHHLPLVGNSGPDLFLRNQQGTELLAKTKQELGVKTLLGISYLVDPWNVSDMAPGAAIIAHLAEKYPGMIDFMRFTPSVNYYGTSQHSKEVFEAAVADLKREAVPRLEAAGVEAKIYEHRFTGLYEPRPYSRCLASGWYGGIGPGGILYWCCEKMFNRQFAFGSLLDHSLAEIWFGADRKRVAATVAQAVTGVTDSPCPVVCKPHEHNKVFDKVEQLRQAGKIELVRAWLEQIHALIAAAPDGARPRLDGFAAKGDG